MRSLVRRVDMFCYRHPKFGIKNLMWYIIIANIAVYVIDLIDTNNMLVMALSFNADKVFLEGQVWRLVTFVFIPQYLTMRRLLWFMIEIVFYYFIGSTLETAWGKGKFTIYYLMGMLLTILYGVIISLVTNYGAYMYLTNFYLNLSLFFAFATLYPDTIFRLFLFLPLKAKWLAWAEAAIFIYYILFNDFPLNLLPVVAILNYLLFCGSWLFDRMKPKNVKERQAQTKRSIEFQSAAREYNRQQAKKPYTRKCEVCGRTDTDYPDLEFRFCSKCGGYHCFCIDHINSHVHFKE